MKNRKGFTLIELLITIVIIISILILAIVNVNNISKKNKDKAWEKVKNEVELAAKDYYETNSYKLAGLDNSSIYARVSVDTLVENDFLNVVTDPRNGNRVNSCDYVEVKLENDNYSYKYHENSSSIGCDLEEVIEIKEVGAPDLELNMSKNPDGKNKYYISDVNVVATVKTNGNGAIKNVKYSFNNEEDKNLAINSNNVYEVEAIDGNSVTVTFSATNLSDKSIIKIMTYKKDTVKPQVTSFVAKSTTKNYNSNNIKLSWNIKDELSGLGDINANIKNNIDNSNWNKNGAYSWKFDGSDRYFIGATRLNGKTVKPTLTVYDIAGNKTVATTDDYKIYKECSTLDAGEITKGDYGKCSNTCGTGTKVRKITTIYKDKYTLKVCDTKANTETKSCTDKTNCIPFITNVSFRYNPDKCPKGHVEIKYKDINIDEYIATMTYSHSAQGTTNTAESKDISSSSSESFCRGYGLSPSNIMTFEVEIVNNLNKSKKATFKGNCKWSKMGPNDNKNNNWHDCTLKK